MSNDKLVTDFVRAIGFEAQAADAVSQTILSKIPAPMRNKLVLENFRQQLETALDLERKKIEDKCCKQFNENEMLSLVSLNELHPALIKKLALVTDELLHDIPVLSIAEDKDSIVVRMSRPQELAETMMLTDTINQLKSSLMQGMAGQCQVPRNRSPLDMFSKN